MLVLLVYSILSASSTLLGWIIISILLVCAFVFYAIPARQLPDTGYTYDEVKTIGERLMRGEEIMLEGITDNALFRSFLVDLNFIFEDLVFKIVFRAPDEDCIAYHIRLIDEDYNSISKLSHT